MMMNACMMQNVEFWVSPTLHQTRHAQMDQMGVIR
jgi:hypothetical protein